MPKRKKLPPWIDVIAAEVNPPTITIDSLTSVEPNLSGGFSSQELWYDPPPLNMWGFEYTPMKTSQVCVNFTVRNNTRRPLTGIVSGLIDNVPLSQAPIASLASGEKVSGTVSFNASAAVSGLYLIILALREMVYSPAPISILLSATTTNLCVGEWGD